MAELLPADLFGRLSLAVGSQVVKHSLNSTPKDSSEHDQARSRFSPAAFVQLTGLEGLGVGFGFVFHRQAQGGNPGIWWLRLAVWKKSRFELWSKWEIP